MTVAVQTKQTVVKPTQDRVMIRPMETQAITAGGLYLPSTAKEKPVRGVVVAAGPGRRIDKGGLQRMAVKVGDEVVYGKDAGAEVEFNGAKHIIIREGELLGSVRNG